jgi:hypothetical protein
MAKVSFLENHEDLMALLLGSLGMSTDYIASKTKLSVGQILYRLRLGQVSRMDYRNGTSTVALNALRHAMPYIEPLVKQHLPNGRPKKETGRGRKRA